MNLLCLKRKMILKSLFEIHSICQYQVHVLQISFKILYIACLITFVKKTENTTLSGDSAPDALNSVEDLVGPVNSNDVLGQEIELYRQKAQQIADTGRAQNVRMMVKWGTAVAKQVEKIQQELANGGNMTISEWNQKKAELDISLAKATNE